MGVRTANYDGKLRRQRRADAGRTNHWKKAIVRLKEGESLDLDLSDSSSSKRNTSPFRESCH